MRRLLKLMFKIIFKNQFNIYGSEHSYVSIKLMMCVFFLHFDNLNLLYIIIIIIIIFFNCSCFYVW